MTIRDTIRHALEDAIDWQLSLLDANRGNDVEEQRAKNQVAKYRAIMKRRYGEDRTPMERQFDGAEMISIFDIPISKE